MFLNAGIFLFGMASLFGTSGIRGIPNEPPMTPEFLYRFGRSAAELFKNSEGKTRILIGRDTRSSGRMVERAVASGVMSRGADVLSVGVLPIGAISCLTRAFRADAGIMVSASHNPPRYNGVKLFTKKGMYASSIEEEKIEKELFKKKGSMDVGGRSSGREIKMAEAEKKYTEFVKHSARESDFSGLKIVVDCANGAAYSVAPKVFREFGADILEINNVPDGQNINVGCGTEHPENMRKEVRRQKADLGISLDGDADRVIMADEKGNVLDGDQLMAIYGLHLLKKGELKKKTLVATHYSNIGLDRAIERAGGRVLRVDAGEKPIINALLKNGLGFGGEFNGHLIFFHLNPIGDGILSALQILNIMKQTGERLSELARCMEKYPQTMVNVEVKEKKDFNRMNAVSGEIRKAERKLKNRGKVYIRYSGTENLARILVQGSNNQEVEEIANSIAREIKKEIGV